MIPVATCDPATGILLRPLSDESRELHLILRVAEIDILQLESPVQEMGVVVDEARKHSLSFDIDDLRLWTNVFLHLICCAEGEDSSNQHCDGVGRWFVSVDSPNSRIGKHNISNLSVNHSK